MKLWRELPGDEKLRRGRLVMWHVDLGPDDELEWKLDASCRGPVVFGNIVDVLRVRTKPATKDSSPITTTCVWVEALTDLEELQGIWEFWRHLHGRGIYVAANDFTYIEDERGEP